MYIRNQLSNAAMVTIVALVAVAVGIVIQIAAGVDDFPRIPPGAVISLVVAGVIVAGARRWWTPIIGSIWAVFLLVGLFVSSGSWDRVTDRLSKPGDFGEFGGTLVMVLGMIVALVTGFIATAQNNRLRTEPESAGR